MNAVLFAVIMLISFFTGYVWAHNSPLRTVAHVDIERYAGKWYEIALIPYFFEHRCAVNARVEYTALSEPGLTVFKDYFQCDDLNGKRYSLIGRAKVIDPVSQAKLSATFINGLGHWFYWMGANYWITDLSPDYRYAVVSHPSRQYGWILSRTPNISTENLKSIAMGLRQQGYDPCRFMMTPQSGGIPTRESLCKITNTFDEPIRDKGTP